MRKYVLSLLFILVAAAAFCQKKSKVNLIRSDRSEGVKRNGVDMIKVYNGVWQQDYSTMRSDSAYFHPSANAFEAFGHVNINQGDTLNIYSDKLNYNGNTKVAILTDNVKMVDKDATLTTNYFTYNTATRIGTYTNGGKIVNKTNTLTSQNGYYFANSHDAYFRYNVVCVTNDALIKTDTMRYNSKTRINYFYGPTHIYGKKDSDVLYTENGTYNTNTEQAFFGKKNLYTQQTKSLKGDSLFYDRIKGYGRAVKHVVFSDSEQKTTIKGGLGTYYKKNDLAVITQDPYVILVTEDSTKTDSSKKPLGIPVKKDAVSKATISKTPPGKVNKGGPVNKKPVVQNTNPVAIKGLPVATNPAGQSAPKLTMPVLDSIKRKLPPVNTDTLIKIATTQSKKIDKTTQQKIKNAVKGTRKPKLDTNEIVSANPVSIKDTGKIKQDSVYMSADTIATRIITFKELNKIQEEERLSHIRDTSAAARKTHIVYKTSPKFLTLDAPKLARDTSYLKADYFGPPKPKPKPAKKKEIVAPKRNVKVDSTFLTRKVVLNDTARVRIIMAFHKGKIFKSDLQAVADSIFYSNSDSTIRCYTKPMIWTQGSQLSGDTIYLQMRHKKLDNMHMFPNAFIVNIENADSTHFNQLGGKRMRGFFKNSKLNRIYIDGNAESIYFVRDSTTKEITDLQHSFSSRMRVLMQDNEVTNVTFLTKPDHRFVPIGKVLEDEKILKGFLWKPKDRPISKESIIPSYNRKRDTSTHIAGTPRPKKMYGVKGGPNVKPGSSIKAAPDSTHKTDTTVYKPHTKAPADSIITAPPAKAPAINTKKDTSAIKPPAISPAVLPKKDTTGSKK